MKTLVIPGTDLEVSRFVFGTGSIMKYIANHLVTIHNAAAAEAMLLGMKAGIDPGLVYDTLADSAATSRMFQMRGPLMRDDNYDTPTATIRTHLKDLSIISSFAAELGCGTSTRLECPTLPLRSPSKR